MVKSKPVQTDFLRLPSSFTRLPSLVFALALCLSILVPFGVAAAQEPTLAGVGPDSEADSFELTLAAAIDLAFAYDLDHEIARLQWENARIDNLIAQASGPVSPYELLERELQERRAENTYLSARNTLVLGVVQQYFDVKQAAHQAEANRRQAEIARRELDVVRQMVRIGERHPQDELREQNRVAAAELSAENADRAYANRKETLFQRLGWDGAVNPVLVSEPEVIPFAWTLDETLAFALEHNFSVWERAMNVRIAAMDLEALRVKDSAPLQLEKAENSLRTTQLNALQGERTFNVNVVSAYYAAVDAAKRYETAKIDYDLARSAYKSALRQHEVGLTTEIDRERAELDWLNAEQTYRDAVTTYMRERLSLFNLIGHSTGLDGEFGER